MRHNTRRRVASCANCPFPLFHRTGRETPPTQKDLELAKTIAARLFSDGAAESRRVFKRAMSKSYRVRERAVKFRPLGEPLRRIRAATLDPLEDNVLGVTDGTQIWISSQEPQSFEQLVSTLVHEGLHYYAHVRGRHIPADKEHRVMALLGEPNIYEESLYEMPDDMLEVLS